MIMKNILPIVMNTNLERIAVVDDYSSLIWTSRYYDVGDFEICVSVSAENINLFQQGNYVIREDDEHVGIVEKIMIQKNEDGDEVLIVSGRFLSSIIGRRIISRQTQINDTVSNGIQELMNNEILNPQNSARKVSNLVFQSLLTRTDTIDAQFTGQNLLNTIEEICLTYGIGFKTTLNDQNQFVFSLYEGVDRSYNQSVNPYVIFSDDYDNLISSDYEENYQEMVTDVLVAGEGEGSARKMLWVSANNDRGLDRYEYFADRRDLQSNDGEIPVAQYNAQLKEAGEECLTKYTTAFTGTVYFNNIEYRTDVNVGDICVIENKRWGLYINSRMVEVIESVNESGEYSILPTFGI